MHRASAAPPCSLSDPGRNLPDSSRHGPRPVPNRAEPARNPAHPVPRVTPAVRPRPDSRCDASHGVRLAPAAVRPARDPVRKKCRGVCDRPRGDHPVPFRGPERGPGVLPRVERRRSVAAEPVDSGVHTLPPRRGGGSAAEFRRPFGAQRQRRRETMIAPASTGYARPKTGLAPPVATLSGPVRGRRPLPGAAGGALAASAERQRCPCAPRAARRDHTGGQSPASGTGKSLPVPRPRPSIQPPNGIAAMRRKLRASRMRLIITATARFAPLEGRLLTFSTM